jgi:vacuolar-type H+-ATPase subunit F/Vma7
LITVAYAHGILEKNLLNSLIKLFDVFIIHCSTNDMTNIEGDIREIQEIAKDKMIIIIKQTEGEKNTKPFYKEK